MDRAQLKHLARQSIAFSRPNAALVTLVYCLLLYAVSFVNPVDYDLAQSMAANPLQALSIFGLRNTAVFGLAMLLSLLFSVISAGYSKYCLDISRGLEAGFGTLLELVPQVLKYICINLLSNLAGIVFAIAAGVAMAMTAWLLPVLMIVAVAAVVGSVYISLGFSQTVFIAIDNPDMGALECLSESWHMMRGLRLEYFIMTLSFIPWLFACAFVIPALWVVPYMQTTMANYYKLISGQPMEGYGGDSGGQDEPPYDMDDMWKP